MKNFILSLLTISLYILLPKQIKAQEKSIHIAVASNFNHTMNQIIEDFQKQHNIKVNVSSGSSGTLYAQIINGAPFDLFFSADDFRTKELIKNKFSKDSSHFIYAKGKILIVGKDPFTFDKFKSDIANNRKRLAMANPKFAPYGRAAKEFLQHHFQWQNISKDIVIAQNISQCFQFFASGNADYAIIAQSQLHQNKAIAIPNVFHINFNDYAPIRQAAVVIHNSINVQKFVHFLNTQSIKKLIKADGYELE